jgi:hypothetical protein
MNRVAIARELLRCYTPLVPRKKPTRKKPVTAKKKPAKAKKQAAKVKKQASKKKPLRKKKPVSSNGTTARTPVVETFEVELVGGSGNLFDTEDEGGDEDFPQEYGGSE